MSDAPAATGRRRALGVLWVAASLAAFAWVVAQRWDAVQPSLSSYRPDALAGALLFAVLGVGASSGIWHAMINGLGAGLAWRASARVFYMGQLGKYLPGSVWPVVTQAQMGQALGVPRRVSAAAVALFLWLHALTAAALGAVTVPMVTAAPWWLALLAVPILLLVSPGPLNRALAALLRLARRQPLPEVLRGRDLLRALSWSAVMWLCYGLHAWLLADGVALSHAVGIFAAAWVAGFVILIAPAGAGAREAAFAALLAASMGAGPALAAVLVSRLLLTLADGVWGVLALAGRTSRSRAQKAAAARDPGDLHQRP